MSFDLSDYEVHGMPEEEPAGYICVPELLREHIHNHLKQSNVDILDKYSNMSGVSDFMTQPDSITDEQMQKYCEFGEYLVSVTDYPGNDDSPAEIVFLKELLDKCKIPYYLEIRFTPELSVFYSAYINQQMQYAIRYDSNLCCYDPRAVGLHNWDAKSRAIAAAQAIKPDWNFIYQHMQKLMPPVMLAESIEPLIYMEHLHENL